MGQKMGQSCTQRVSRAGAYKERIAGVDYPLEGADSAYIEESKLRGYALNPEYPKGKHKARVFASALGIGQDDWEYLRDQILEGIVGRQVAAIRIDNPVGYGI